MEDHRSAQEDALRFARIWKRVMPEGGPIVPAFPVQAVEAAEPAPQAPCTGEEEGGFFPFLKAQITAELRLGRQGQQLWRRTGCGDFAACAGGGEKRARRLAAALYLLTGEWYLSMGATESLQKAVQANLRTMYCGLQSLELDYLAQAAQLRDEETALLLKENADGCHRDGIRLRRLLEERGPL